MNKSKRPGSNTKSKRDARTRWNNDLRVKSRKSRNSEGKKFKNPFLEIYDTKVNIYSIEVGGKKIEKGNAKSFTVGKEKIVVVLKSRKEALLIISGEHTHKIGKKKEKYPYMYQKRVHPKVLRFYLS